MTHSKDDDYFTKMKKKIILINIKLKLSNAIIISLFILTNSMFDIRLINNMNL